MNPPTRSTAPIISPYTALNQTINQPNNQSAPIISPYPESSFHTWHHTHRPDAVPDPNSIKQTIEQSIKDSVKRPNSHHTNDGSRNRKSSGRSNDQESKEQVEGLFDWPSPHSNTQSNNRSINQSIKRKPRDDWKQPIKPSLHLPVLRTLIDQSNNQSDSQTSLSRSQSPSDSTKSSPHSIEQSSSPVTFPPLSSPHNQLSIAPHPLDGIYEYTSAFEQSLNLKTGADAIAYFSRYGNQSTVKFVYANRASYRTINQLSAQTNNQSNFYQSNNLVLPDDFRPYDLVIVDKKNVNPLESFTISPSGITCLSISQPNNQSNSPSNGTLISIPSTNQSINQSVNQPTEVISLDQWIHQSNLFNLLRKIRFFKHFLIIKFFLNWKKNIRYQKFVFLRKKFAQKTFFGSPSFVSTLIDVDGLIDQIDQSTLSSMRPPGFVYTVDTFMKDKSEDLFVGVKKIDGLIDNLIDRCENVCRSVKDRARLFDHRIANEELSHSRFAQHLINQTSDQSRFPQHLIGNQSNTPGKNGQSANQSPAFKQSTKQSNKQLSMVQAKQLKINQARQRSAANAEADRLGEFVRLIDCKIVDCLFSQAIKDTRSFLVALMECKKPLFGTTVTFAPNTPSIIQVNSQLGNQSIIQSISPSISNQTINQSIILGNGSLSQLNNQSSTQIINSARSPSHSNNHSLDQSITQANIQTNNQDGLVYSPTAGEICSMIIHARDLSLGALDSLSRLANHPKFQPFLSTTQSNNQSNNQSNSYSNQARSPSVNQTSDESFSSTQTTNQSISSLVHLDVGYQSMIQSINQRINQSFEGVHQLIKFIAKHRVIQDYGDQLAITQSLNQTDPDNPDAVSPLSSQLLNQSISQSINQLTIEMNQLTNWSSSLQHIRDFYSFHLSQADLRSIKQSLLPICAAGQQSIKQSLITLFISQCDILLSNYQSINQSIRDDPVLLNQFVDFVESVDRIQAEESKWSSTINQLIQLFDLLKQLSIYQSIKPADQVKYEQVLESRNNFQTIIRASLQSKIESKSEEMKQKVMSEIKRCDSALEQLMKQVEELSINQSIDQSTNHEDIKKSTPMKALHQSLAQLFTQFRDLQKKIDELNRTQRVLDDTQHTYKLLPLLQSKLDAKRGLFDGYDAWKEKEKKWNLAEIERLDCEAMDDAFKQWNSIIHDYQSHMGQKSSSQSASHHHISSERASEREKKEQDMIKQLKNECANYSVLIPILTDLKFVYSQLGADGYKATFSGLFGNLKRVKDLKKLDWTNNAQLRQAVQQKVTELKDKQ